MRFFRWLWRKPLRTTGLAMMGAGVVGMALGAMLIVKANEGLDSLDAVYKAQNVVLTYNEDGIFVDRGTVEGGAAILSLLEDDWKYPLNHKNLDPSDPLVNTPDELMVQFAMVSYHTLTSTQTVVLTSKASFDSDGDKVVSKDAPVYVGGTKENPTVWDPRVDGYKDAVFEPGTYSVPVGGRYYTGFNTLHPLDRVVRSQAWGPLPHALLGEIVSGVNADYQAGLAHFLAWSVFLCLGAVFFVIGIFLTWSGRHVIYDRK